MRSIRPTAFATVTIAAMFLMSPQTRADETTHQPGPHLNLTNATFDSVVALSIAPDGTDAYHAVQIGEPLQGGETSTIVDVPPGGCLRAVRVTFRNGHSRIFPHIDLCGSRHLRLTAGGAANPD